MNNTKLSDKYEIDRSKCGVNEYKLLSQLIDFDYDELSFSDSVAWDMAIDLCLVIEKPIPVIDATWYLENVSNFDKSNFSYTAACIFANNFYQWAIQQVMRNIDKYFSESKINMEALNIEMSGSKTSGTAFKDGALWVLHKLNDIIVTEQKQDEKTI